MAKLVKSKVEWEGHVFERSSVTEGEEPETWTADSTLKVVGKGQPRIDGPEHVTGRAKYTCDIRLPGMLYARILRSPHPHARIKHLDTTKAVVFPGVRAVLSHNNTDIAWNSEPLFGEELVFAGDEVAALAADNDDIAGDALKLIAVEYEVLPFVIDAEDHKFLDDQNAQQGENSAYGKPIIYKRGDLPKGFREADVIVEETFQTQSALHNCLETHGAVAVWNGDELTVWESTQSVFHVQEDLADVFQLPLNKVRVICEYMGGGFGSKQSTGKWSIIAALLARAANRPVQLMLDRCEESLSTGNRAPTVQHLKMGAKSDGTLTAIELQATVNIGAYGSTGRAVDGPCQVMYACPNVHTELRSVFANTGPQRSFRGPGYVEGAFPLELLIDELASRLKMDPLDIRMKNYAKVDSRTGQKYSAKNLDKCYHKGAEAIGWVKGQLTSREDATKVRGYGMASQTWGGGGGPPAFAWVKLNSDGTAEVITGSQDIGTGTRTVFAQIAAEELGLEPDQIVVHIGDTAHGPYDPVSWGSMTVASVGPAVRQAAIDARNQLNEIIGGYLNVPADKVLVQKGKIYLAGEQNSRANTNDVLGQIGNFTILGKGARGPNNPEVAVRTFGAQFAEVEVNTLTGEVKVLRLITVHDCGRVINHLGASNQGKGAVVQGIGYALTEERITDKATGIILNPNLEDYMVPTALDLGDIGCAFINDPDVDANNLGVKGIGESALIPTAPAIANAIAQAIGIRFLSIPITRAKIVEALQKRGNAGGVFP
ncbi:MAG: xanthine dehydrogenase family protein molybdopterin-binding subunit [Dehalococcoidales bacterium]